MPEQAPLSSAPSAVDALKQVYATGGESPSGPLITAPGGEIEIAPEGRAMIAVFRNGVAIVARGSRWSSETKAVLDRAFRANFEIGRIVEEDSDKILALYGDCDDLKPRSEESRIERQEYLRRLIAQAAAFKASDIHIQVRAGYCEIRIRVHGRLRRMASRSRVEGSAIINAAFAVAADQGSQSGAHHFMKGALNRRSGLLPAGVDLLRLQYTPASGHLGALVMRIKYAAGANEADIVNLGYLPSQIADFASMRRRTSGLYLLAGKVSSGKTTTLQRVINAMIGEKSGEISVYSIEEPVELEISGAVHVAVAQRPGQSQSEAFIDAIKAALRSDPNVVVLGELRDRSLAKHAIELAMTGHALWSTLHAGSALGILDRLADLGIEPWKLAEPSIVRGLAYQRLVGVMCRSCKIGYPEAVRRGLLSAALASGVSDIAGKRKSELFVRGAGCNSCDHGLTGRSVAAEIILPAPRFLELYAAGDRQQMRHLWLAPRIEGGLGGLPVMHHAMLKVVQGDCDINEIEEEIDLFDSYCRDFPDHASRLARDAADFGERESG
ncbi:MAG: ATPase, T2SS/T4P/T4SS family [Albidovulum sp.]|nr:ATPase, T2SS/T4P/T4SS family [Albidovulum sp.]